MRTADFDYELPPELIAQTPAEPRDAARLMVLDRARATIAHRRFSDLPEFLHSSDLLVVNDTRVMAARLVGVREDTGGAVEALLVRPLTDTRWLALFRPGRQASPGRRLRFPSPAGDVLCATVLAKDGDTVTLDFDTPPDPVSAGTVPLPPYIRGYTGDPERYQTVYSRSARSAAAPTAGLHFTTALLARLAAAGIERTAISLDVGPGTFKPVSVDDPRDHVLHAEHVEVPAEAATAIQAARLAARRVVAVGTTVVRTLEHAARESPSGDAFSGWTSLKLLPGDRFLAVDALTTNFHLPRSTLLMLVCAFAGTEFVLDAYREAVAHRYRFYSFGDAMLVV